LNADTVLKIFLIPVIILIWGIGWVLFASGNFLCEKSEKSYHNFLNDIKGKEETEE